MALFIHTAAAAATMEAADEVTGGQSSTDNDKPGEGLTCTAEGGPGFSSDKFKDDSSFF